MALDAAASTWRELAGTRHRDRVAGGADRSTAAVLLIPRLSDDQLREIVRLTDPLATER